MGLRSMAEGSTEQSMFGDIITFHVEFKEEEKSSICLASLWLLT